MTRAAPDSYSAEPPTSAATPLWKRIVPWVVTLLLVGYLAVAHDMVAAWNALLEVKLGWAFALWIGTILAAFVVDTACLHVLFSRLNAPVSIRELLPVKGASYFINIINYNAAAGAIAWFLRKRRGVPFLEAASSMLLLNVIDLVVLNLYVTAGLWLAADRFEPEAFGMFAWANAAIYAVYLGAIVYWNAGVDYVLLGRLRGLAIFSSFRKATLSTHARLVLLRTLFILVYVFMQYSSLHLFGIAAPFGEVMVYNAIITFIGTIPISVAGLGTTQIAMLQLYGPYGTDAQILAYSTSIIVLFALVRALIGYCYLGEVTRSLGWGKGAATPAAPPELEGG